MSIDSFLLVSTLRRSVDDYLKLHGISFNILCKKVNNGKNAKRLYLFFKNKKPVNIGIYTLFEYYCFVNKINYDHFCAFIKDRLIEKRNNFKSLLDNDNQLFLEMLEKKSITRSEAYAILRKVENNLTLYSFIDICELVEIDVLNLLVEYDNAFR